MLQDLLDEWPLAGWQTRPHDALRDPLAPRRMLSPNEKYAALVAAAGYLPLTLTGQDYLELLPVEWRQINACGIRVGYRMRVWVTVAVGVVAPELDADGVTVTVVGSVVVLVSGEVFPPRIVSPEFPPDSGPPLTLSTSVTVAMLPAKITAAAAAPASTTVDG